MRGLPISVKTRLGYNRNEIETWIPELLETGLAAITIHGRTRKEMSKVPAHWDLIGRVAEIAKGSGTLILGNGDVETCEDARVKCKEYGVDGVMIGRGVFGNPWLFSDRIDVTLNERLSILVEHTTLFEELLGSHKSFDIMKKHYKAYVTGFDGAKELRVSLMACSTAGEVAQIVKEFCPEMHGFQNDEERFSVGEELVADNIFPQRRLDERKFPDTLRKAEMFKVASQRIALFVDRGIGAMCRHDECRLELNAGIEVRRKKPNRLFMFRLERGPPDVDVVALTDRVLRG